MLLTLGLHAWVIPLKDKKGITITNAFQKILKESNRRGAKSEGRSQIKYGLIKVVKFTIAQ